MYKNKRKTALVISLIMAVSLVLNPVSVVYASVPTVNAPTTVPFSKLETPAKVRGVKYEFKGEVKKLPKTFDYEVKPMPLEQFASVSTESSGNSVIPGAAPALSQNPSITAPITGRQSVSASQAKDENKFSIDKINGIKYPAGSKILSVPRNMAASFTPRVNEIYVDEEMGTAFRVLDTQGMDVDGNPQYAIETPQMTDIFKSYSIPEQTIDLTTGNIAYIAPEFALSPESGMQSNYTVKAGISDYLDISQAGNKHIITIKRPFTIFEYPSDEEKEKTEEEKKRAQKEKFKGDWWKKEQNSDLRGVENESSLSVSITAKEGTITVENPKFHSYFDLNPLTTHVAADFYFDAKATADITLEGDLTFNKTIEKCVYGYDIDLGKVMGEEKGNKAFVGIFLVIGVEGKVHVEVRTITTGDAKAGFAYKAYGYGSIPYFAGPYATFRPASFDTSFTVNGEINATLACVPQVGVIVWGTELGVMQIWVGFKTKAIFSASGGGGSSGAQDFQVGGSIDLKTFGELVGYLLGSRYSIFYIDFPLYHGEWKVGEEVSGSGGDAVREVAPLVRVTADAYTNKVEGKIAFSTAGKTKTGYIDDDASMDSALKPYANAKFALIVNDRNSNQKFSRIITTDAEGNFSIGFGGGIFNILPTDKVIVDMYNLSPEFKIENSKYKVVGKSPNIIPIVPFSKLDLNIDSFNDVITGWVSGKYTGSVQVEIMRAGNTNDVITVNSINGIFKYEYPINELIIGGYAIISFEGSDYISAIRSRNLDALTINIFNDFKPAVALNGAARMQGSGMTIKKGVDINVPLPESIKTGQDKLSGLTSQDSAGRKFIKPTKVFGSITNKGDMGWIRSQGDEYVRAGTSSSDLRHFDGNVKITEISVQSALEAMMEDLKGPHADWLPKPKKTPWTATVQAEHAMELKAVRDSRIPTGFRIDQIPTSAARFEFNNPDVCAYKIEIEHEGLTLERIYNPYTYHYNNNQQSVNDFLGPLKEAATLVTEEHIDSVVNPADVMNQWNASWITQIGTMQLTQKGSAVTGTIMQGGTAITIEGTVSHGVFKGSILVPSESSVFGDIVSVEMNISTDGKTIDFRNIGANNMLRSLKGSKAIKR